MKSKVNVYILTGFLGSGKSTLLARLLANEKAQGNKVGVIMNELGEISIDSSIVPGDAPLKELLGGCICCSIQGELSLQLSQMLGEYELDSIYIEATGAAHPMEIIHACSHPTFSYKVHIQAVISMVDAKQWSERATLKPKVTKLIEDQVKYADVLIINKIDKVDPSGWQGIEKDVATLNPKAYILPTQYASVDPNFLQGVSHKGKTVDGYTPAHVQHSLHLRTFSRELEGPVDRLRFESWMKNLPGTIYRGKGFLQLTESPGLFSYQFAYGESMFVPFQSERPIQPVIVIIGEDLEHERMEKELRELQQLRSVDQYRY
ncbi:GTP-binding protein [Ammoniphilus sp. CFH 90114]|uniref:CobW family GTP-binding protein n=1 Tax=Ammoniphilus sp. CFH 90114 TaxID=2493665 RepID=UPI0013E98D1A|nr:GTP-binding protein [Ammoniphilus sp. CFH 90114]